MKMTDISVKKKMLTKVGLAFATLFLAVACHKNNTLPTPPPATPTLQGTWSIYKFIYANFDTSGGMTSMPNDTVYLPHPEVKTFTKDTVYAEGWENFVYVYGHPDTFYTEQSNEWFDTSAYISTAAYFLETRYALTDTTFILQLTDTTLAAMEKVYPINATSGPVLLDIYIFGRKPAISAH
jgi:hypothetical protein